MNARWAMLSAAATLGLSLGVAVAAETELPLTEPQRTQLAAAPAALDDFELTDQEAKQRKFSDLRGRHTLVFFGFTNCPQVCPAAMQKLRQVKRVLDGDEVPVQVVLISVDGERDTPEAMKAFLGPFGEGFVGLTGAPGEVRPIANRFKAVFFKGGQLDAEGGYNVEHTSQIYFVDADGRLRATFYNAPDADIVAVVKAATS